MTRGAGRRIVVIGVPITALALLAAVLVDRRAAFTTALDAAPLWLLLSAVALQEK